MPVTDMPATRYHLSRRDFAVPGPGPRPLYVGGTQAHFAQTIGVPVATVRNWEQGRREPTGAARVLLDLIAIEPDLMEMLLRRRRNFYRQKQASGNATGAIAIGE